MARILHLNDEGIFSVSREMLREEAERLLLLLRKLTPPGVKLQLQPV